MTIEAEAYNAIFVKAVQGLCANPAVVTGVDNPGRLHGQLKEIGTLAEIVARHASEYMRLDEELEN